MDATQLSRELPTLKSKLTRAQNSGDPQRVIAAAEHALARFEVIGWPDCWSLFQRAHDDAQIEICYRQRDALYA